jgi:hypothetical protein
VDLKDSRILSKLYFNFRSHSFFKSIDWEAIFNKKIKPPFIPKIKSESDTRYIDSEFTNCTPTDSYNPGDSLGDSENPYKDFSYNTGQLSKNDHNNDINI